MFGSQVRLLYNTRTLAYIYDRNEYTMQLTFMCSFQKETNKYR